MTILFSLVILIQSQQNQKLEISVKSFKTFWHRSNNKKQTKKLSKFSDSKNRVARFS